MAASSATLEAPPAAAAVTPAEKGGKKKLLLIVGGVVVLAAVALFFLKPADASSEPATPPAPVPGEVVEVGQMTVNLADASRYARVSFSLMLVEGAAADQVAAQYPLLKEAVLFEVSKLTAEQVRTTGGLDALAKALTERAQEIYPDGEVLRVVLTEMLVQ